MTTIDRRSSRSLPGRVRTSGSLFVSGPTRQPVKQSSAVALLLVRRSLLPATSGAAMPDSRRSTRSIIIQCVMAETPTAHASGRVTTTATVVARCIATVAKAPAHRCEHTCENFEASAKIIWLNIVPVMRRCTMPSVFLPRLFRKCAASNFRSTLTGDEPLYIVYYQ
jgi:hypothetical protein